MAEQIGRAYFFHRFDINAEKCCPCSQLWANRKTRGHLFFRAKQIQPRRSFFDLDEQQTSSENNPVSQQKKKPDGHRTHRQGCLTRNGEKKKMRRGGEENPGVHFGNPVGAAVAAAGDITTKPTADYLPQGDRGKTGYYNRKKGWNLPKSFYRIMSGLTHSSKGRPSWVEPTIPNTYIQSIKLETSAAAVLHSYQFPHSICGWCCCCCRRQFKNRKSNCWLSNK